MKTTKMKIEVWSDIVCPSCYIGKRKLENAVSQFAGRGNIEIIWKSFQLEPDFITNPNVTLYEFLQENKGMSRQQVTGVSSQITALAKTVGLVYNLEKAIPANSFRAGQLSHLAKLSNLQNEVEERLFKAYFTDGKNIDDIPTLVELGNEIGLDAGEIENALETGKYAEKVRQDLADAKRSGITSIPTFVFDGKLKVTGAQESSVLMEILEKIIGDRENENTLQSTIAADGQTCSIGEDCG